MKSRIRFPIRFKFMLALLVLVTAVVSFITFSTANLLQNDKRAYINGLTSMVALGVAEESRAVLQSYKERLVVYTRIMTESDMAAEEKTALSENFFNDFPQLISLTLRDGDEEPIVVFDPADIDVVGLSMDDLRDFERANPLPIDKVRNSPLVQNSTLSEELPCMTLAYVQPTADETREILVSAVLRLEDLLALASRFGGYDVFLVDSQGTLLAHSDAQKVAERTPVQPRPELESLHEKFSAGLTLEFEQDGIRMIGGFASVDFGGLRAAAQIPRSAAFLASRTLVSRLILVAAVLLLLAVLTGFLWANRLTRPVELLSRATHRIGRGEFDVQVRNDSTDEIGTLAQSFNQMVSELRSREEALQETQSQLVQSEKMAAFGQLGAGIAHEVKNPLAGILGCAQLAKRDVEQDSQLHEDLKLIEKETKRCKTIIDNILKFARQEKAVMDEIDVNQATEDAISIINHQLVLSKVKLEKNLQDDLPKIRGNSNQLQQVFMNLMINAQQAMEDAPGSIKVSSRALASGQVELLFSDTGPGMSEETRQKVFEPFFTTKPNGKGTGLGLSVSFGIIKDHAGEIDVKTELGEGTNFIITFPTIQDRPEIHEANPECQ